MPWRSSGESWSISGDRREPPPGLRAHLSLCFQRSQELCEGTAGKSHRKLGSQCPRESSGTFFQLAFHPLLLGSLVLPLSCQNQLFFFFKWFYALSKINLLKRIMKISQKTFTVNGVWAHSMESAFKHFPPTKQGGCFWSECLDCASLVSGHCPPLTSMAVITTGCCRLFRDNSCRLHTNVTLST